MTTESGKQAPADGERQAPRVFLSYASENKELAGQIANTLMKNGIKTWWDKWEIRSGDSIRQKIDEGIEGCTHFLVLLTPQSIDKEWVKTEMDAAFFNKREGKCRFIAVRHELAVDKLPPTLRGLLSPEIESGTDIDKLINDIHGVSEKPPLGQPPAAVLHAQDVETVYSPAASTVAKLLVKESKHGLTSDPQATIGDIATAAELSVEDAEDAIYELKDRGFLKVRRPLGKRVPNHHVSTTPSLFVEFDRYFMGWDAVKDAVQIATGMANDTKFTASPEEIVKQYGWAHRRLNPALKYLVDEEVIHDTFAFGIQPLIIDSVQETSRSAIRKFLREHQT